MAESDMGANLSGSRIAVVLVCALLGTSSQAETLIGRVVGIADGDTITILDGYKTRHKIRLAGIDAPEQNQPFGQRSKKNLASLVFNRTVHIEWDKRDRYGRTVGKVMVNGVDANLEQIKAGMAWWYEKYRKEQTVDDQSKYSESEKQARALRVGLWIDADPIAPWDWRKNKRQ